jgi:RHS repeat-associated protein
MSTGMRRMVVCLLCCFGMSTWAAAAQADTSLSGDEAESTLSGALVISGSPTSGEQLQAQEEAMLSSPEAVAEREASRTKFERLTPAAAEKLDGEAFSAVIDRPSGGSPNLPKGQTIAAYRSDNVAQVNLPEGKHGVIESSVPIAVENSLGKRVPVDLSLNEAGGAWFEPNTPVVAVRIPKRLGEGVALQGVGVSLTPVDAQGSALGGSEGSAGVLDGASTFFANIQADSDLVVKPVTEGFETDTLLRSVESPQQLSFRVALPDGATLAQATNDPDAALVLKEGAVIASVLAPGARDAAGTSVPMSMTVSGSTLTLTVDHRSGAYLYPIAVDPTVKDEQLLENWPKASNWREEPAPPSPFSFVEEHDFVWLRDFDTGTPYARGEWGAMAYETQGESHIYEFASETDATNAGGNIENKLFISSAGKGMEKEVVMGSSYGWTKEEVCVEAGCAVGKAEAANEHNAAEFKQTATNPGSEFSSTLWTEWVGILQEAPPKVISVNTTSQTIGGQPNYLYPGVWAGRRKGVAEITATDPGIGVSYFRAYSPNKAFWQSFPTSSTVLCNKGVQCSQTATAAGFTAESEEYGNAMLPDGEDTIELTAGDEAGLTGKVSEKIKVDGTPPHNITLSGLPANKELGNGQVKVKATAQDGATIASSGVESISLKVDGKEVGTPSGSCSPGPCTATSGEWTLNGAEYPAGQHKATITATDHAGNVASEEYPFYTGHLAVPVGLGPGSVSPETGEFFLHSTDVSVDGPGATLSVTRSYGSSHLTAGAEGPLGPQWSMTVGGTQSLTKAAEGAVVLTDAEGQQSVFTSKGGGEFNSPPQAASVKLTEVLEGGKTKEFLLKDGGGQTTKFALPSGGTGNTWVPATLEGPNATNAVTYAFRTVGAITEPTLVLGPVPAGVSCTSALVKGCRALNFVYGAKTTASGDGASEWGEYEGRLKEVTFTAWDRASAQMKTTAVAQYVYDKEGKLRGAWDPRVSPALEITYGYDAAGHVTAMTPPGRQPWLFNYGTATGDTRARIVSAARPSASTAAGNGAAPTNTSAPALSTSKPRVGVPLSVSNGTWSNSPLSYSYQWETCTGEVEGKRVCSPILGATSQTYTPAEEGVRFAATVTASNANGALAVASSSISSYTLPGATFTKTKAFGSEGSGTGQLKEPSAVAVEGASTSEGSVWVADTGNNRIEKFKSSGPFAAAYGAKGKENGQFERPVGIALDETDKHVFVADAGNKRIEVFEASTGKYLSQFTTSPKLGELELGGPPAAIATGKLDVFGEEQYFLCIAVPSKNWVTLHRFNPTTGAELEGSKTVGSTGTGAGQFHEPVGCAFSEKGNAKGEGNQLFVTDTGNHRVEVFESERFGKAINYVTQFGTEGSGVGQFSSPGSITLEPKGLSNAALRDQVFVADSGNSRVQQASQTGENPYDWSFGSGSQSLAVSTKAGEGFGSMYVLSAGATGGTGKVAVWAPGPAPQVTPPEPPNPGTTAVWTVEYHVPVSGTGRPYAMGKTEVEAWGQKDDPVEATAIFPPDEPMGWPAKDYRRATVDYLDGNARLVNVAQPGGVVSVAEYNAKNDVERTLSPDNRVAALKEGSKSVEVSKLLDTENTYNTEGTELQSTLGPQHNIELPNGTQVLARHHVAYGYDEGAPTEGGPYGLPTKTTEGAQYAGKEEDVRETTISYAGQEGLGWKLHKPTSVVADSKGLKLTHTMVYEASTGELKEAVMPAGNPNEKTAHATETIYYTTAKNTSVPACGEHPEWANLPCQLQPAKQPETSGLPNLPVTTTTYNMWEEPEKTTETVGATTRTKTATYDGAGRLKTSAASSTVGTALPTVSNEYGAESGALEKQSTTTEGKTKTITSAINKLGQLTSYTDSDENTSTYNYDIDGRTEKVSDGKGTQTYTYGSTVGVLAKLVDSAAGTFNASYDPEGNMLSESYPNGMSAKYTYSQTGTPTNLEYIKTTHCTENCTWFSDTVVPSIHGQALSQTSTLSSQNYAYDGGGRLAQVQSASAGKGCTTRIYAYDEDTNRTSLTTREPGTEGKCASEGGLVEKHTYDPADRLHDTGVTYSTFGNITALPAADAGGSELTSAFYVDDQLQSQTQNGETIGYNLDPNLRTRETVSTGKTNQDLINHYPASGASPAWTIETPSGNWTRNIKGIGGGLVAIQVNGGAPMLQLADLHGDIVATAALSETETKLLSTTDTSEYGVPTTSAPAKYSWLGGQQQPTELPSGVIAMGTRSYVPQLGRFLQTDPIAGGSANAYAYTFGDPVNSSDPSGALTYGFEGWLKEQNNQEAQEVVAREVARETLEREEAERRAREAEEAAAAAAGPQYAGGEEGPLGGSAGWACEYAAETGQEDAACTPKAEWLGTFGSGATSASLLSKGWEWVKKNVKRIIAVSVGAASTVVIGGVTLVSSIGCVGAESEFGDQAECWKIAVFGAGFTVLAAGTTVKAWYSLKENRP